MTSTETRIVKIVAEYFGQPIADVTLDTRLRSLTDHAIDQLDIHEIIRDIEEVFKCETDDGKHPLASDSLTVRDFLKLIELEGVT